MFYMSVSNYTPDSTKILHTAYADFLSRQIGRPVHIVQYDDSLPILAVKLFKDGQPYTIPSNADVNIRLGKSDGNFVHNPALGCDSTRQIVYFEITYQMSVLAGEINPIVEIVIGGNISASSSINIIIDRNPVQEETQKSTSEWKVIEEAIEYAKEAIDAAASASASRSAASQSASEAETSEKNAARSATDAASSAKAASTSATDAATSEKNASTSEKNAKSSETNSKTSEVNAKNSETNAASSSTSAKNSADIATAMKDQAVNAAMLAQTLEAEIISNLGNLEAIFRLLKDYRVTDYLLDSSGNKILDNSGTAVVSTYCGFEALILTISRLVTNDHIQDVNISTLFEEVNNLKNMYQFYSVYENIQDSEGANVLDSSGNNIGGCVMHIVK